MKLSVYFSHSFKDITYSIYVVEQYDRQQSTPFNRAKLLNVGVRVTN